MWSQSAYISVRRHEHQCYNHSFNKSYSTTDLCNLTIKSKIVIKSRARDDEKANKRKYKTNYIEYL